MTGSLAARSETAIFQFNSNSGNVKTKNNCFDLARLERTIASYCNFIELATSLLCKFPDIFYHNHCHSMNSIDRRPTEAYTILCIGSAQDPHIQVVREHVKAIDSEARVVLFNPMCDSHFIEINAGNRTELGCLSCTVVVDSERIAGGSIKSVWYRWKPSALTVDDDRDSLIAKGFALREWKSVIRSLSSYLPHAIWLNPLAASELMNCKPHQLKLAQQLGLTVPPTTITNNPEAVERLFERVDNGRVIFKSLTPLFVPPDKLLYTTEIKKEFPSKASVSISKCPGIYQKLVERRSDLRITVVGREVFVARVASQVFSEENDRLDWRRPQDKVSESFKERLLEFHERAGLVFGAYDFLEQDDDLIFLECNPGGAWLWLEESLGLNVSKHVAKHLLSRDNKNFSKTIK